MSHNNSGIFIPPLPSPEVIAEAMRQKERRSLAMGMGVLLNHDGSVAWQDEQWNFNALHDAGEQDMLQVYLSEAAHKTKFLALLNDASIAETDGTMSAVTESKTAGVDGYARQQVLNTDWTNDGLQSGDYRFSAAEKTFGPITGTAATATHAALCTTSTGAGLLLLTLPLSATTTIAVNQSFKYILRWTQQ